MKKQSIHPIYLSIRQYPETCWHIIWAITQGQPEVLHVCTDKASNRRRRKASLKNVCCKSGYDRDEYPMACCYEGGNADVKYICPHDNRGSGASIGAQLRGFPDGTPFKIIIIL